MHSVARDVIGSSTAKQSSRYGKIVTEQKRFQNNSDAILFILFKYDCVYPDYTLQLQQLRNYYIALPNETLYVKFGMIGKILNFFQRPASLSHDRL